MSGQTTTNATEVAVPEKKAITVSQVQQDLKFSAMRDLSSAAEIS